MRPFKHLSAALIGFAVVFCCCCRGSGAADEERVVLDAIRRYLLSDEEYPAHAITDLSDEAGRAGDDMVAGWRAQEAAILAHYGDAPFEQQLTASPSNRLDDTGAGQLPAFAGIDPAYSDQQPHRTAEPSEPFPVDQTLPYRQPDPSNVEQSHDYPSPSPEDGEHDQRGLHVGALDDAAERERLFGHASIGAYQSAHSLSVPGLHRAWYATEEQRDVFLEAYKARLRADLAMQPDLLRYVDQIVFVKGYWESSSITGVRKSLAYGQASIYGSLDKRLDLGDFAFTAAIRRGKRDSIRLIAPVVAFDSAFKARDIVSKDILTLNSGH
ncbi:uncharacterized protein PFL1_03084 [Pseudozyma flocculosa PF-1]|uniref:Uncharacterized protein n=1 Tax=Pseudozyma flocculosa PF-1 TaxID=1277687 RepID=A0A061HA33_9BASI|nr:uncharacterized protein PFL1_03084 [Pseudozyma flocculosa PF-1]EPQ29329.1 hypothetical protein PFL1_03084 [Pseudozyma flocculosa PF-1]